MSDTIKTLEGLEAVAGGTEAAVAMEAPREVVHNQAFNVGDEIQVKAGSE